VSPELATAKPVCIAVPMPVTSVWLLRRTAATTRMMMMMQTQYLQAVEILSSTLTRRCAKLTCRSGVSALGSVLQLPANAKTVEPETASRAQRILARSSPASATRAGPCFAQLVNVHQDMKSACFSHFRYYIPTTAMEQNTNCNTKQRLRDHRSIH